jgi:hypothetical protein
VQLVGLDLFSELSDCLNSSSMGEAVVHYGVHSRLRSLFDGAEFRTLPRK